MLSFVQPRLVPYWFQGSLVGSAILVTLDNTCDVNADRTAVLQCKSGFQMISCTITIQKTKKWNWMESMAFQFVCFFLHIYTCPNKRNHSVNLSSHHRHIFKGCDDLIASVGAFCSSHVCILGMEHQDDSTPNKIFQTNIFLGNKIHKLLSIFDVHSPPKKETWPSR